MNKKVEKMVVSCLCVFSCIVLLCMIALCFNKSTWKDEVFVFKLIQNPYSYFLLTNRDAAPPLHFIIMKFVVDICKVLVPSVNSIIVGKLVAVVPFIILVIFSFAKISKYFGWMSAAVFSFLITTMPKMFRISIEVRMYSWVLLFATLCFFYFYVMINENSRKGVFKCTIFGALAAYTHYYACFVIAFFCIIYLLYFITIGKKDIVKKVSVVIIGSSLLFSPWLIIAGKQVIETAENFWIPKVSIADLIDIFTYGFVADVYEREVRYAVAIVFYILLIIFITFVIKDNMNMISKITIFTGILLPFAISFLGIAISLFLWPVFQARYIIPSLGCFWFAFSIVLSKIKDKHRVLFIGIIPFLMYVGYLNVNKNVKEELVYKENMEHFQEFFNTLDGSDILFTNNYRIEYCLPMYINNEIFCWRSEEMEDWEILLKRYLENGNVYYLDAPPESEHESTIINLPEKVQEMGYLIKDMGEFRLEYVQTEIYKIDNYG
ncbi:hypothetical protein AALB47_22945 [Lachnospiraceae bacterium 54-11]